MNIRKAVFYGLSVWFLVVANAAIAADWVLAVEQKQLNVWIDVSSISRNGSNWKAWTLWDYAAERTAKWNTTIQYQSSKTLTHYNCTERTSAVVQDILYKEPLGKGEPADSSVYEVKAIRFEDVIPDTIGETLLNEVCKRARARPAASKSGSK